MGKSATAKALIHDLGVSEFGVQAFSGAKLRIEEVERLFNQTFRYRPMAGSSWHILLVEEMELVPSKNVNSELKDQLSEQNMPERLIVVATSNDASGLDEACCNASTFSRSPPARRLQRPARPGWIGFGKRKWELACLFRPAFSTWAGGMATSPCVGRWRRWVGLSKSTAKGWWPHEQRRPWPQLGRTRGRSPLAT